MVFPVAIVLLFLGWFAFSQLQRILSVASTLAFISQELGRINDGTITSFSIDKDGLDEVRTLKFERMDGTGLRGSPLTLGDVSFDLSVEGKTKYAMSFDDASMNPRTQQLLGDKGFRMEGPDRLVVTGERAIIDFTSFRAELLGRSSFSAEGGLSATSDTKMTFDPENGEFQFLGKTSAFLPKVLPNLE